MKLPSDIAVKERRKRSIGYYLIRSAGLLLGIFLVYWFVSRSDLNGIWEQLQRFNIFFLTIIAATFTAYFMATAAWRLSFYRYPGHLSVFYLFVIRQVGESLAQINPTNMVAGDALKAALLKRHAVPWKDSIVSLTLSRFLILFSALSLVMIGASIFFDRLKLNTGIYTLIAAVAGLFTVFIVMLVRLGTGKGILSPVTSVLEILMKRFPHAERILSLAEKLREVDEELIDFYRTRKIHFTAAFLLSFCHWLMGAMEFYLILRVLGFDVTYLSCVAIEVGVMVFKAAGAAVPGQIGIEEYASKVMIDFVNVPSSNIWITVSILRRARQLFWILAGFVAFLVIMRVTEGRQDGSALHNA